MFIILEFLFFLIINDNSELLIISLSDMYVQALLTWILYNEDAFDSSGIIGDFIFGFLVCFFFSFKDSLMCYFIQEFFKVNLICLSTIWTGKLLLIYTAQFVLK